MYSQGLGLFAARDMEKQTMVIEYNGTILRNEVATRKEKSYRTQVNICFLFCLSGKSFFCLKTKSKYVLLSPVQNRAVFMFRIDSEHVVDATRTGGLARYCELPRVV